jgi:nucleotide-binding universal stress UspA family protein
MELPATVQAASVRLALTSARVSKFAAGLVTAENRRLQELAEAAARSAQADAAVAGIDCTVESPHLGYGDLLNAFRGQARLNDLTILDAESETVNLDRGLMEALLMDSGRPLLIVPPGQDAFRTRRIILAWDGSARAARAAVDALPLLRAAEGVDVVSVTGEKDLADAVPGAGIATHLARHGVAATALEVEAQDGDVAQALRNTAVRSGADMIVMGGYAHSRLREMMFGGVTHSLLKQSPVPLFLAY